MAFLSGYTTRKKLTIDNTKVDATLTNLPVLVKLTSGNFDFAKANTDGFDIRFTESDGETLLKYERERHDNGNSLAEYWVKVPSVASGADTDFYIYYRTTDTADGADPTAVWDANYVMVQHLKDLTTSTTEDSTSNDNDGVKVDVNEPIEADGKIAKAQDFDGSDDYIVISDSITVRLQDFTISAWVYLHTAPGSSDLYAVVNKFYFQNEPNYRLLVGVWAPAGDTKPALQFWDGSGWQSANSSEDLALNRWYHLVGTFDSQASGGTLRLYVDSVLKATVTGTGAIPSYTADPVLIGRSAPPDLVRFEFDGLIDEVRMSNTDRGAAWIKGSYNSGNDSLLTYGGEESSGVPTNVQVKGRRIQIKGGRLKIQ